MKTLRLAAVAVVVGAALVSCSRVGGEAGQFDNACELLTTSEVEDLLGVATNGPSEDTDRSSGTYCEWVSEDSADAGDASDVGNGDIEPYFISVEDERGTEAVQGFEAGKVPGEDEAAVAVVRGLGDDAYFDDPHGLSVRHGDRVFSTFVDGNDQHPLSNDRSKRIERRAAELIIDRLGEPERNAVIGAATECARTGRCAGTRYRACDLLHDQEVVTITGYTISRVDGTSKPAGSARAAICEYFLESVDPESGLRVVHQVEILVEPDPEDAERAYRRAETENAGADDLEPLLEIGEQAFYVGLYDEVYVLEAETFLAVSFEVRSSSGLDEHTTETKRAVIEFAEIAASRL